MTGGRLGLLSSVGIGQYDVNAQTIRQLTVPDGLLGRVSAVSSGLSGVATPIDALLGGVLGEAIGVDLTMGAVAVGMAFIAVTHGLHPRLRTLPAVTAIEPGDLGIDP